MKFDCATHVRCFIENAEMEGGTRQPETESNAQNSLINQNYHQNCFVVKPGSQYDAGSGIALNCWGDAGIDLIYIPVLCRQH